MTETNPPEHSSKPSWLLTLIGLLVRHAREVVGGALAIAGTIEDDVRVFVVRFVRDMVMAVVLLFLGLGFIVFGVGIVLVEALRIGTAAGSVVVGVFFVAMGSAVFFLSRR